MSGVKPADQFCHKNEAGEVVKNPGLAFDIDYLKVDTKRKAAQACKQFLMNNG